MKNWLASLFFFAGCGILGAPSSVSAQDLGLGGVAAIAAGDRHTCALTLAGGVRCWGNNTQGQLGDGSTSDRWTAAGVAGLGRGVKGLAAGGAHTCALTVAGGVKCWGDNSAGQLGDGSMTRRLAPVDVAGLASGVTAIALGREHSCALTNAGGVKCWGSNAYGKLGAPAQDSSVPNDVTGLSGGVRAISVGDDHSCALTAAGVVMCWGGNLWGEIQGGPGVMGSVEPLVIRGLPAGIAGISAGFQRTCAVTEAGGVACWGETQFSHRRDVVFDAGIKQIEFGAPVAAVSNGDYHLCAVTTAGGARCLGDSNSAQLGDGTTTPRQDARDVSGLASGVVALAGGRHHACALTVDGSVRCWGGTSYGVVGNNAGAIHTAPVGSIGLGNGMAAVAAGGGHTCALTAGGGVKCWGGGLFGQLGDGARSASSVPVDVAGLGSGVAGMAAGAAHHCALTAAGAVKCWGAGYDGQLGDGGQGDSSVPVDVAGLAGRVQGLAAGTRHNCALLQDGGVQCWGLDADGQASGRANDAVSIPKPAGSLAGLPGAATALAAGEKHSCALLAGGGVVCWGGNGNGQLGNGAMDVQTGPVAVVGLDGGQAAAVAVAIAAGNRHTCALTVAGGVKCWGSNERGQLGDGNGTAADRPAPVDVSGLASGVVALAAGGDHTCALTVGGGIKCWGANAPYGQLGDNSSTNRASPVDVSGLASGVAAVSAGGRHTCAVTAGGTVQCWGDNFNGQSGDGADGLQRLPTAVLSVPVCTLAASPASLRAGQSAVLTAACIPAASSAAWSGALFGDGAAGGVVRPFFTTSYSMRGGNAIGVGESASVTVTVTDSASLSGKRADYVVAKTASGYVVTDIAGGGVLVFGALKRLRFADGSLALDIDGVAGMAYRLYQAAFNRSPDLAGLGFQMAAMEVSGWSLREVAQGFIDSPEFSATYGALDDSQFVRQMYANVLRRAPEADGLKFYLDGLASGAFTRAMVLAGISESPENQALVLPAVRDGISYTPWFDAAGNGN